MLLTEEIFKVAVSSRRCVDYASTSDLKATCILKRKKPLGQTMPQLPSQEH